MSYWDDTKSDGDPLTAAAWYNKLIEAVKRACYVSNQVALDLSATGVDLPILHADTDLTILKVILVYTEASSSNTGVELRVGKESDDNYFYTGTSEVSKSQWYEKEVTLLQTDLDSGDTLTVGNAGSKTGAGEVIVCVWYIDR